MAAIQLTAANVQDEPEVRRLWKAFEAEIPEPVGEPETWEEERSSFLTSVEAGLLLLARVDGDAIGVGWATPPDHGVGHIELIYVDPRSRRRGVSRMLVAELARRLGRAGAATVTLEVVSDNAPAVATWAALGFREIERTLAAPTPALAALEGAGPGS